MRAYRSRILQWFVNRRVVVCGLVHWPLLMEVPPDGFGGFAGDYGGEGFGGGLPDVAEAAEVGDEALAGLRAYAGDVEEF